MKKLSLELPKYRLQLHFRFIKRRKPLVDPSIIPTAAVVNKKYRSGTLLGKVARHLGEHKAARKIFAANFAVFAIASAFLPTVKASTMPPSDETVIQAENPIDTQKGIQLPLGTFELNQGFNFFHPGVDLGAEIGDPIKPVKSGVVTFAGFSYDGYGNNIIIDHGKGLTSLYAHLSKIEVKIGQNVDMNTEIGRVGVTGHSTGPHLHLEIRQNGVPLNPLTVLAR